MASQMPSRSISERAPTLLLTQRRQIIHASHWKFMVPYRSRHDRVVTDDPVGNGKSDRTFLPPRPLQRSPILTSTTLLWCSTTGTATAIAVGCRGWEPPAAHCRPGTGRSPGSQGSAFRGCRRTQNPPAYDANRRRDRISVVRRPALPPSRMCRYRSGAGRPHHNRGTRRLQGAIHLRAPRNHSKQNFHVRARLVRCRARRRVD